MVGSTGGTERFGVEFGGEVVAVKDHIGLYPVMTQHFDSVHDVVDVFTRQHRGVRGGQTLWWGFRVRGPRHRQRLHGGARRKHRCRQFCRRIV